MVVGGIKFRSGGTRGTDRLTDKTVKAWITRAAAGTAATRKLSDGGGLYLTTTPTGTPVWRLKYRLDGCERAFAIGIYPSVTLAAARAARGAAKELLAKGIDPTITRRVERTTNVQAAAATFGAAVERWLQKQSHWAKTTAYPARLRLDRYILPQLGKLPIGTITSGMIGKAIEAIQGDDTAKKVRWLLVGIFNLAMADGLRSDNPAIAVKEHLAKQSEVHHFPALVDLPSIGDLLRRADLAHLSPSVHLGHRLCAYTVSRIGPVLQAEWPEFALDGDPQMWTIPREKQKEKDRDHDHVIFLGPTITGELRKWRSDSGGKGYLLPSPTGRAYITHEALEKAYRKTLGMAGVHSPHSWRTSFSTLAHEAAAAPNAGFGHDAIEMVLDHVHGNAVSQAYDRAAHRDERLRLAYWWDAQLTAAQYGFSANMARGRR